MNAVAYCRVSTNKDEQLGSLEAQQKFFAEYAVRNGLNLVRIYADEGKSGTKMKNRTQLLKLLSDANRGVFETVLIKDVSRLARNTVDFLTSIRKLKALGVRVIFVNYDQTTSESSEFMLTMLSAIAQEESANTSKRIKFGKKLNAEKGRVPNIVYGYDKIPGDCFNLTVNQAEAETVRRIFDRYVNGAVGESRIASELNRMGLKTKRGCVWTQNAVSRILTNELYIGNIVNGKEEVADFLTGKRKTRDPCDRFVTLSPALTIIDRSTFLKAARLRTEKAESFRTSGERSSDRNLFSKLIRCGCCGASFRRTVRSYSNTYIKWVCSARNLKGTDACPNAAVIDEAALLEAIRMYFRQLLSSRPDTVSRTAAEFERVRRKQDGNLLSEKELRSGLGKLYKAKEKYLEMYAAEIITLGELREKSEELTASIDKLTQALSLLQGGMLEGEPPSNTLSGAFEDLGSLLSASFDTNAALSMIFQKIEVDSRGNIDAYIKSFETAEKTFI